MRNLKHFYSDRIITVFKVILSLILVLSTSQVSAIEEYESTKYKGKNKYQRIGEIEDYLTKISNDIPKQIELKIAPLQKKITDLETKISPNGTDEAKVIQDLRAEIAQLRSELLQKIDSDVITLVKKIEDEKRANEAARDSLRTTLDAKILAIEKIISGFGKVNTL
ncbi:hypothetical protein [Bacteriovorax sp. Seq25_V]|uniref:hypothetical protein n=1 Tax=Bacteriovorax sp. Seq25_V TaxID=1201288 RepID=UPI000389E92F|nr:hypothetical protein [Bacteriovorax sp. Seq25_V]EQC47736.1 hypothetical protein M900_A0166 [Bacteriovorax sp. Seq25_V]